jgi:hypothetical protein
MSTRSKLTIAATMSLALLFGFLDAFWPEAFFSCKRLHIFLFNLLSGGVLIIHYSEGKQDLGKKAAAYYLLSLGYALSAAARLYAVALALSLPLFALVESVRIRRFSLFPLGFFRRAERVCEKFHQASLLCLSLGIAIASLVILNNEYFHLVAYPKLTLDVFFLGYSFPISLITMSLMFSFMPEERSPTVRLIMEMCFWIVNLGVITFFVFIIFEMPVPEIAVATTLFLAVCVIYYLFVKTAPAVQQKTFLLSGMTFLLLTALTGIFYILHYYFPALAGYRRHLLELHAMVSLYGWNLSGLIIIMRRNDFPIRLNSLLPIALHWAIVLLLAPLGKVSPAFASLALAGYVLLLGLVLMSRGPGDEAAVTAGGEGGSLPAAGS